MLYEEVHNSACTEDNNQLNRRADIVILDPMQNNAIVLNLTLRWKRLMRTKISYR